MASFRIVKKSGAPAGAIRFALDDAVFTLDDSGTTYYDTTDERLATDLLRHPFLTLSGVTGAYTPPPLVEDVFLVDGTLSKHGTNGNPVAVTIGAATVTDASLEATKALVGPSGSQYRFVAGVIRNYNDSLGWQLIRDGLHPAIGITNVDSLTDTSVIHVDYPNLFTGAGGTPRTGSLIAVPDETLAQAGFFCGSSVAPGSCDIKLGRSGALSDYLSYSGGTWTFARGHFAVSDATNNTLTVTHTAVHTDEKDDIRLTRRGNGPIPVISASSGYGNAGDFKIDWIDPYTGAKLTTPTTAMTATVSRGHVGLPVSPNTVHTGTYPNSNIWLIGVHQRVPA